MRKDILREVVAALRHDVFGIEAQLLTLPRDTGDDPPRNVLILNAMEDEQLIAGEQYDRGVEILVVVAPNGFLTTTAGNAAGTELSYGRLPVAVAVFHRGSAPPPEKLSAVEDVLRCGILALSEYFQQRQVARSRNGVNMAGIDGIQSGAVEDDGTGAVGAIQFTWVAFDTRAQRRG